MKKTYVKPMIVFEDFKVSSSIAAGCDNIANSAEGTCGYLVEDVYIFSAGVSGCEGADDRFAVEDEAASALYQVCYHIPSGMKLFTS